MTSKLIVFIIPITLSLPKLCLPPETRMFSGTFSGGNSHLIKRSSSYYDLKRFIDFLWFWNDIFIYFWSTSLAKIKNKSQLFNFISILSTGFCLDQKSTQRNMLKSFFSKDFFKKDSNQLKSIRNVLQLLLHICKQYI